MATAVTPQVALLRLCSECGEPIPAARLKAKPNARQCVACLEAMGDVPVYRRVEERAGQVEKLFKGDEDEQKHVDRNDRDEITIDGSYEAPAFDPTDEEEAHKPATSVAAYVAEVSASDLAEIDIDSVPSVALPDSGKKQRPNYRGVVWLNKLDNRWMLRWWQDGVSRAKNIGTREQFPTELEASRAAEPLREWFRNHPEVFKQWRDESEYEGSVWFESRHQRWKLSWNEQGERAVRVIGTLEQYPTKEQASEAAEPIRDWFRAQRYVNAANLREEREEIAADIVKAKREESERTVEALFTTVERKHNTRHYRTVAGRVLGIYLDQRHSPGSSGNIRAIRISDASKSHGKPAVFQSGTKVDFVCDVEISARGVLTLPLHVALFRLLYIEARFSVELARKRYAGPLDDMHALLGRDFERRGISPTHEYFRPFNAPEPKRLR